MEAHWQPVCPVPTIAMLRGRAFSRQMSFGVMASSAPGNGGMRAWPPTQTIAASRRETASNIAACLCLLLPVAALVLLCHKHLR